MTGRLLALGVAVVVGAGVGRAELPRHKARPGMLCGVPDYAYCVTPPGNPPPTVTAVSLVRVPAIGLPVAGVGPAPGPALPPGPKPPQVYQLREPRLQIDHCFLSRVAVALHPDGAYQISFRADQNPQQVNGARNGSQDGQKPVPLADPRSPLQRGERVETALQTTQFRRNLFVVKVRGYGSYPVKPDQPGLVPGPPALIEFPTELFWVQRGEPYSGQVARRSEAVRQYFDYIDRIEVEFTYR